MAPRHRPSITPPDSALVEAALAAMNAEALRELARSSLAELDGRGHARVVNRLFALARACGWSPAGPPPSCVAEAVSFARAAAERGRADPRDVDEFLREAQNAFHRRDYASARAIFEALFVLLDEGDIDLGQRELVEEMLYVDTSACASEYLVATYMVTEPDERADSVHKALGQADRFAFFHDPLQALESAAVEPLPEFEEFLVCWRDLLEGRGGESAGFFSWHDSWLRSVTCRLEGSSGLAELARTTRKPADLRAWCQGLSDAGDWKAALSAYQEAAETVVSDFGTDHDAAAFFDGAALAAQQLGRRDLPSKLEAAWRAMPTLTRLVRWLGSARSKATLKKRARAALRSAPPTAQRQLALLHLLLADPDQAAELLASAPGLGWSSADHPGHLLFPLFEAALTKQALPNVLDGPYSGGFEHELLEDPDEDAPALTTPSVPTLLGLVGAVPVLLEARSTLCAAMKTAAEKRIAGVTEHKRRDHYGHAAELVASCVALCSGAATTRWVARLRATNSRFSALQRELTVRLGAR